MKSCFSSTAKKQNSSVDNSVVKAGKVEWRSIWGSQYSCWCQNF